MSAVDERVRREWDAAEQAIKQAEQTSGSVPIPAINELRYAGRRVVDALSTTDEDRRDFLYRGALENCRRARLDAIDATALYWMSLVYLFDRQKGPPRGAEDRAVTRLKEVLNEVATTIAHTREDRDGRIEGYEKIERLLAEISRLSIQTDYLKVSKKSLEENLRHRRWAWLSVLATLLGAASSALALGLERLFDFFG